MENLNLYKHYTYRYNDVVEIDINDIKEHEPILYIGTTPTIPANIEFIFGYKKDNKLDVTNAECLYDFAYLTPSFAKEKLIKMGWRFKIPVKVNSNRDDIEKTILELRGKINNGGDLRSEIEKIYKDMRKDFGLNEASKAISYDSNKKLSKPLAESLQKAATEILNMQLDNIRNSVKIFNDFTKHINFDEDSDLYKMFSDAATKYGEYCKESTRNDILDMANPWCLTDVLKKLAEASDILLNKYSYDGHKYEEISHCVKRANEIIEKLSK